MSHQGRSSRSVPPHVIDPLSQREQVPGYLSEVRLETVRLVNTCTEAELRGLIASFSIEQIRGWLHATLKQSSEKGGFHLMAARLALATGVSSGVQLRRWRDRLIACRQVPSQPQVSHDILGLPTELGCKVFKYVDLKTKWLSCMRVDRAWRRMVLMPESWEVVEFPRDLWYSFAIGRKIKGNTGGSRTAQSYMLRWMPRWLQARSVQFLPDFALNDRSGLEALHTYVNQLPSLVELDLNAHLRLPFANHDHLIQEHQLDILVTSAAAPRLTSLSLFAGYLEEASFAKLAVCARLKKLSLTRCRLITDLGLLTVLRACPDLEELLLTDAVRLTPATFGNIVKFCPKLHSLTLTGSRAITAEALAEFSDSALKGFPPLRRLELNKTQFFRGLSPQNTFLSSFRDLEVFMIDAPILPEQWRLLLTHCSRLRVLHVHGLLLADEDLVFASQAACAAGIEDLYLEQSPGISEEGLITLIKATPRLRRLKITETLDLTDRVMYALGQHCPCLRNLSLPGPLITDCGLVSLLFGVRLPRVLEEMLEVLGYHREVAVYEAQAGGPELRGHHHQQQQEQPEQQEQDDDGLQHQPQRPPLQQHQLQQQQQPPEDLEVLRDAVMEGVQQSLRTLMVLNRAVSQSETESAAVAELPLQQDVQVDDDAQPPQEHLHPHDAEANADAAAHAQFQPEGVRADAHAHARGQVEPPRRRWRHPRSLYVDRIGLGLDGARVLSPERRTLVRFMMEAFGVDSAAGDASGVGGGVRLSHPQRVSWPPGTPGSGAGGFRTLGEHVIHGALSRLSPEERLEAASAAAVDHQQASADVNVVSLDAVLLFDDFRDAFDAGMNDPRAFDKLKTLCRDLAVGMLSPEHLAGLFQLQGAVENHPSYAQRYRSIGLMPGTYHLAPEEVRDLLSRDLVQVQLSVAPDGRTETRLRPLPPAKTPTELLGSLLEPPPDTPVHPHTSAPAAAAWDTNSSVSGSAAMEEFPPPAPAAATGSHSAADAHQHHHRAINTSMEASGSDNEDSPLPDDPGELPPAPQDAAAARIPISAAATADTIAATDGRYSLCHMDGDQASLLPLSNRQLIPQLDAKFLERWESGERGRLVRPSALAGGCWDLQMFVLTGSRLVSNLSAQMLGLGADMLRVAVLRGTSIDRVGVRWLTQARNLRCVACSGDSSRKYLRVCGISSRPTLTADDLLRYGVELEEQNLDSSIHTP